MAFKSRTESNELKRLRSLNSRMELAEKDANHKIASRYHKPSFPRLMVTRFLFLLPSTLFSLVHGNEIFFHFSPGFLPKKEKPQTIVQGLNC